MFIVIPVAFLIIALLFVYQDMNSFRVSCEDSLKRLKDSLFAYENRFMDVVKSNSQCCHSATKDTRERITLLARRVADLERINNESKAVNPESQDKQP